MARNQVTVVVRLKAKLGREVQVRQELTKLLRPTRAEKGCINFDMHQNPADPALFLFHEDWEDEDDLKRHFETPHIRDWVERAKALLAEPMELTRW